MRLMRLIGLIGLIGFMSCSSDGVEPAVDPQEPPVTGTPITFSGERSEEQAVTRMSGDEAHKMRKAPLSESVQSFQVWGFKNMSYEAGKYGGLQMVFPGYTVRWTANSAATSITNSNGWEYINQQPLGDEEQTIKYWDWSAVAYRFFGVAGATGANSVKGEQNTATVDDTYTVTYYTLTYRANASDEDNTPYYSHLWFSTGNPDDYPGKLFGQPVKLEFIKPLSKVRFMFIFEDPSKAEVTELTNKEFRPNDGNTIKEEGDVIVSYPLTGTDLKETFSVSDEAGGLTELTQDYYEAVEYEVPNDPTTTVISPYLNADVTKIRTIYTVLPTPAGQSAYKMTVSVDGEPKTAIVPAQYMTWLPGYQYTYIFKIHIDGSVAIDNVESAFTEWKVQEDTHTVYNW